MENIKDFILKNKLKLKNDHFPSKCICKVCENVIVKAKVTICGHSFCGKCIMEHLSQNNNCPDCEISLNADSEVSNDFRLDIEIKKLMMTCPNPFCDIKLCVAELSLHVNECTSSGAGCTLAALGCDSIVKSNRELEQHSNSELAKQLGLLMSAFEKFRDENQTKMENLNKSVVQVTKQNVQLIEKATCFEEEMRANKRENVEIKKAVDDVRKENTDLKREIDKIVPEIRPESRARTEGASANPTETVQHELGLSGAFSASAQYKFSIDNVTDKVERSSSVYKCNEFYLHNYKFTIAILPMTEHLCFCVHLGKGNNDEDLLWPLKRRMRWKVLDADDSDKVLAVRQFSYETGDDGYKHRYYKPPRNEYDYDEYDEFYGYYKLEGSTIKEKWSDFVTKDKLSFVVEME